MSPPSSSQDHMSSITVRISQLISTTVGEYAFRSKSLSYCNWDRTARPFKNSVNKGPTSSWFSSINIISNPSSKKKKKKRNGFSPSLLCSVASIEFKKITLTSSDIFPIFHLDFHCVSLFLQPAKRCYSSLLVHPLPLFSLLKNET